eukprot:COSAG04_NODE_14692_length_558_cov_5.135076_2_plen_75_part_01
MKALAIQLQEKECSTVDDCYTPVWTVTVRVGAWLARHWRRTSGQGPSPWGRGARRHIGGAAPPAPATRRHRPFVC